MKKVKCIISQAYYDQSNLCNLNGYASYSTNMCF